MGVQWNVLENTNIFNDVMLTLSRYDALESSTLYPFKAPIDRIAFSIL